MELLNRKLNGITLPFSYSLYSLRGKAGEKGKENGGGEYLKTL